MNTQTSMTPDDIERLARKRAGAKMGWFFHATVYVCVNLMLWGLSDAGWGSRSWSFKPLLGWGLGLALHGASVWLTGAGSDLRERMVQKERERLQRSQQPSDQP